MSEKTTFDKIKGFFGAKEVETDIRDTTYEQPNDEYLGVKIQGNKVFFG